MGDVLGVEGRHHVAEPARRGTGGRNALQLRGGFGVAGRVSGAGNVQDDVRRGARSTLLLPVRWITVGPPCPPRLPRTCVTRCRHKRVEQVPGRPASRGPAVLPRPRLVGEALGPLEAERLLRAPGRPAPPVEASTIASRHAPGAGSPSRRRTGRARLSLPLKAASRDASSSRSSAERALERRQAKFLELVELAPAPPRCASLPEATLMASRHQARPRSRHECEQNVLDVKNEEEKAAGMTNGMAMK